MVFGPRHPDVGPECVLTAGAPGQPGPGGLHGDSQSRAPDGFVSESTGLKIITPNDRSLTHD